MSAQKAACRLAMDAHVFGSGPELERRIREELGRFLDHGAAAGKDTLCRAIRGWIESQRGPDHSEHAHARTALLDDLEELLDGFK